MGRQPHGRMHLRAGSVPPTAFRIPVLDSLIQELAQPNGRKELVRDLAKVLNRPIILPNVPSVVLRLLLGEMSTLVLGSQRVNANKIEGLGFTFKFHHLRPALEDLLLDEKGK